MLENNEQNPRKVILNVPCAIKKQLGITRCKSTERCTHNCAYYAALRTGAVQLDTINELRIFHSTSTLIGSHYPGFYETISLVVIDIWTQPVIHLSIFFDHL